MLIRYNVTIDDLVAFASYHRVHSPQGRKQVWLLRFAVSLIIFIIPAGVGAIFDHLPLFAAVGAVAAAIYFMWLPRRLDHYAGRALRAMIQEGSSAAILGPHSLTVTDEALVAHNDAVESKYQWSSVGHLGATDTHVLIYVSAVSALVVRKASVSEGDLASFMAEVRSRAESTANV